jgi:hypothetical protein
MADFRVRPDVAACENMSYAVLELAQPEAMHEDAGTEIARQTVRLLSEGVSSPGDT